MDCSTPGLPVHQQLLESIESIESVMPSNHLILCCPLLLLPSIFPNIRVISNESVLGNRWPNIGASASASVLPMNIQDWFPLEWTGWISLQSKRLSRVFSNTTVQKHQFFRAPGSSTLISGTLINGTLITSKSQTQSRGWKDPAHSREWLSWQKPIILMAYYCCTWFSQHCGFMAWRSYDKLNKEQKQKSKFSQAQIPSCYRLQPQLFRWSSL